MFAIPGDLDVEFTPFKRVGQLCGEVGCFFKGMCKWVGGGGCGRETSGGGFSFEGSGGEGDGGDGVEGEVA